MPTMPAMTMPTMHLEDEGWPIYCHCHFSATTGLPATMTCYDHDWHHHVYHKHDYHALTLWPPLQLPRLDRHRSVWHEP